MLLLNMKFISSCIALLTEDFCGVEPVTHPPIEIETRPPPLVDEDKLRKAYGGFSVVLGSKCIYCAILCVYNLFSFNTLCIAVILVLLLLLLLLMVFLIGRYVHRHKGDYLTHEDEGAANADDPDEAVLHSRTGHQVTKRKEWFI